MQEFFRYENIPELNDVIQERGDNVGQDPENVTLPADSEVDVEQNAESDSLKPFLSSEESDLD